MSGSPLNPEFAAGYQKVAATIDLGSTTTAIGQPIGPTPIEPGQKRTFTFEGGSPETDLYFGTDSDCGTSWAVFWRVTAPDGKDSLLTGMCSDIGRWHTNTPGTWRVDVSVPADSSSGGTYAFRVLRAGPSRIFPITLPAEIGNERPSGAGILKGPGAEHRFQFEGLAGDEVSVTAALTCTRSDIAEWCLEDPDGFRVTLRTPACKDVCGDAHQGRPLGSGDLQPQRRRRYFPVRIHDRAAVTSERSSTVGRRWGACYFNWFSQTLAPQTSE